MLPMRLVECPGCHATFSIPMEAEATECPTCSHLFTPEPLGDPPPLDVTMQMPFTMPADPLSLPGGDNGLNMAHVTPAPYTTDLYSGADDGQIAADVSPVSVTTDYRPPPVSSVPPPPPGTGKRCHCGAHIAINAVTCANCGHSYRPALLGIISLLGVIFTPLFAVGLFISKNAIQHSFAMTQNDQDFLGFLEGFGIFLNIWLFTIWLRLLSGNTSAWLEANWALGLGLVRYLVLTLTILSITRAWAGMELPVIPLIQMLAVFLFTVMLAAILHAKSVKAFCKIE